MGEKKAETPAWFDQSKAIRANYAPGYTGWVIDLGDGTCRFANSPLLGANGPKWGDRVDLYYPCDKSELPFVGYRVYPDGTEPNGKNLGYPAPSKDEEDEE